MEAVSINETTNVPKELPEVISSENLTNNTENVSNTDSSSEIKISKSQMKRDAKKARWQENKAERRYAVKQMSFSIYDSFHLNY